MSKDQNSELPIVSEQIAKWRRSKGLTQFDLESRAGLSHNTISRLENGQNSPRVETVERIAQALDLSIEELHFRKAPVTVEVPYDHGIETLASRIASLSEDKRNSVLKAFNTLLDQMEGE